MSLRTTVIGAEFGLGAVQRREIFFANKDQALFLLN